MSTYRQPSTTATDAPSTAHLHSNQEPVRVHIRSSHKRRGNLLLDLPIAGRLTFGFLLAAMIATVAAGFVGVLRAQSLSLQANFYQSLLQTNTSLNTGANFLQLMNTQMHVVLNDVKAGQFSQETFGDDKKAVQNLEQQYDQILQNYNTQSLLEKHPDQTALLNEAGQQVQVTQQRTLLASTLRTWNTYKNAQDQVLQYIIQGRYDDAAQLERLQAEPTNTDATSALRTLIQFDQRIANSVRQAGTIEQQSETISTIASSILAFILIALVGWLVSSTLVQRLQRLRQVTRAVEMGQLDARVPVVGRDEIADVSASVNAMLDAILHLLEETRRQRDALTNAAEHLFSDMRIVSAGDLRINAPVSNDPIGTLANAFNFTVGRFRRFVLRTQTTVEQVDVIARQEMERSEQFSQVLLNAAPGTTAGISTGNKTSTTEEENTRKNKETLSDLPFLINQTRERLQRLGGEGIAQHTRSILTLTEQISTLIETLNKELAQPQGTRDANSIIVMVRSQELQAMIARLKRLISEIQKIQRTTVNGFVSLDAELAQVGEAVKKTTGDLPASTKEAKTDLLRLGLNYTNEMIVMARHLNSLSQEMRAGIAAFQLETDLSLPETETRTLFSSHPQTNKSINQSTSNSGPLLSQSANSKKLAAQYEPVR